MLQQLLQAASEIAAAPVTGEDLLEAKKRLRASTGQQNPSFSDPPVLEAFKRHLREVVKERQQ